MIIDDLDIECVTVTPPEADPPLLVDPNAVLALPITLQSLKLIRARNRKILKRHREPTPSACASLFGSS